jgi:outer membrane protein TolC
LRRRPDIRIAERRIAGDTARVGVAMSALYPDIRLGASIGSTGAVVDRFSPLTNRFALGPQISWTVNRSAVRARVAGARAGVDADLAAFDGSVLKALREVEAALNTYAADLDRLNELTKALEAAALVAEKTHKLRAGAVSAPCPRCGRPRCRHGHAGGGRCARGYQHRPDRGLSRARRRMGSPSLTSGLNSP